MGGASQSWEVEGRLVLVSHPTKVLWSDGGITKEQMLRYYEAIAPFALPHFKDRPVTVRIFPEGTAGPSYYRRDMPEGAPLWIRYVDYRPETTERTIQLPLIDDAAGLLWFAQAGATEFHLWASRAPLLSEPDMAIFDLDPGDRASFADVLQAALHLRQALERLGLRGYPKTSGGRGLHVYIPLAAGHSFEQVRAWVKGLAEQLAAAYPERIALAHGATHRGQQVTVDHAQNSIGRNTAGVYTVRARPGAPVSTPLTWDEVEAGDVRPLDLTLHTVGQRLRARGDLFAAVLNGDQRLPSDSP
jgi:bifunctional non-homologous end joining protein LigD